MHRALLPIAAVVLVALLWWTLGREPARPVTGRETQGDSSGAKAWDGSLGPAQLNAIATAPLPLGKGSLQIRGLVRDARGPVAGATVTATAPAADDLTELRAGCPDADRPVPLLEAGCADALRQIIELVSQRRGEAPPAARATTDAEGRYALSGLEDRSYTLWADGPGSIGARAGVRAGDESADVWLTPGARIRGIVLDEIEHPISGAVVTAVNTKHSRFFDAVTGPDGRFALGPVLPGTMQIVAHAEGRLPAGTTLEPASLAAPVELKLHRARSLRGRVLRDEAPAAGVKVRLESRGAEVVTSADGAFSFERLRPGEYELVASDGAEQASAAVTLGLGDSPEVILRLERGAELAGTVLSEEGAPVADARISLKVDARAGRVERAAVSGPGGTFRLAALPPGRGMLVAKADGYLPSSMLHVVLAPGQPASAKVILHRAAVVSGIVVGPDGTPLAAARVQAAGNYVRRSSKETGADGAFVVELPAPDEYELLATHDDFRPARAKARAPASGIRLQLERGLELRGRLVGDVGDPVPFAELSLSRLEPPARPQQEAQTGADGTFAFKGLDEGRHRLFARVTVALQERMAMADVEVPAPGPVELRLVQGGEISGRVTDASGKPVAEAHVRATLETATSGEDRSDPASLEAGADSGAAQTSEDGRFTIAALRPGSYVLEAWKYEWRSPAGAPEVKAHPGDTGVAIVLEPQEHLTGRVVDEGGRPLTRFRLNMKAIETADGTFSEPIEEGDYRTPGGTVTFDAGPDYAIVTRTLPPVSSGQRPLGDVVMLSGQPVTGRTVDAVTGAPVAGALVDVGEANGIQGELGPAARLGATVTGVDGQFSLPRVDTSRRLQLFAEHPDYLRYSKPLERAAGNAIALERAASISGHVFAASGRPYRGEVHVFARDIDVQVPGTTIEPDGAYRLGGLPPGDYRVFVSSDDGFLPLGSFDLVLVTLRAGEARVQDLRERAAGVTVRVHLVAPPGSEKPSAILIPGALVLPQTTKELSGLILRAQLPEEEEGEDTVVASAAASAGPTGTSSFSHVPPGHYTVLGGADVEGGIRVHFWSLDVASSDLDMAFTIPSTARVFREGDDAPDAGP